MPIKCIFLSLLLVLSAANLSFAASMTCKTTGLKQQVYKVSKGKIAGFKAFVRGNTIYYNDRGMYGRVTSNGKVYRQGRFFGRIKCDFQKFKKIVSGG